MHGVGVESTLATVPETGPLDDRTERKMPEPALSGRERLRCDHCAAFTPLTGPCSAGKSSLRSEGAISATKRVGSACFFGVLAPDDRLMAASGGDGGGLVGGGDGGGDGGEGGVGGGEGGGDGGGLGGDAGRYAVTNIQELEPFSGADGWLPKEAACPKVATK